MRLWEILNITGFSHILRSNNKYLLFRQMTNTLHIKNELKQLTRLYAFLDQQAGTYELGELQSMQIKLALEEAVTNVIQYAIPTKKTRTSVST